MKKKRLWLWNLLIVLTVIVCLLAFLAHSKNWTKIKPDKMQLLSGFYYKELQFSDIDSVQWVEKIPPMERLTGFSAFDKGKGIYREFKDSLTDEKVYVYVDNFSSQKIRLVYKDSLQLYVNMKDSTDTEALFQLLQSKIAMEEPK
ncbi:hypothetical protein FK220_013640 [Flavobacteriaceae bacterium TP-CH-4]|uniref:Uncharacterized protein n=1 Tax=Pelagihabitans pacificus TaxID=2696054 RepID=A0A967EBJ8_9FLAO|nr:hypothetical protein [Pelagihabitans pacificus]NHF60391.1 hypothetical protein [Pelagihabitans pacificus]